MSKYKVAAVIGLCAFLTQITLCECKEQKTNVETIVEPQNNAERIKLEIEGNTQTKDVAHKEKGKTEQENRVTEKTEVIETEVTELCNDSQGVLFADTVFAEEEENTLSKLKIAIRVSADRNMAEKYNVPYPGLYYKQDGNVYMHSISEKASHEIVAEIAMIVAQNSIPLFREVTEKNYMEYDETKVPTAYIIAKSSDVEKYRWIEESAKLYRRKMNIGLLDYDKTEFFLHGAGITREMMPCLFIITEKENGIAKYVLKELKDSAGVNAFIQSFLDMTLEPFLMSEPMPSAEQKENKDGVQKVVTHNYKDIVLNPVYDTLVVYHVVWCKFCKDFMPHVDKVSALLRSKGITDVVIAQMLMSSNDLPHDVSVEPIRMYPSIRLYKKGTNMEVELSNEGKDKPEDNESLLEFIKAHTDIPKTLSFAAEQDDIKVDL